MALAATNTTLSGSVAIDIYQNRLRIFETSGSNRGVFIDLANGASSSVGTNLLSSSTSTDTFARNQANAAFLQANTPSATANSAASYANSAFLRANTPSDVANSAASYANSAFTRANSSLTSANGTIIWNTANAAFTAANAATATDTTQNNSITASFNTANAAFTRANNSLDANNGGTVTGTITATSFITTGSFGNILGANTIYANNFVANTGFIQFADGTRQFTANGGNANLIAAAFNTANAAFLQANTPSHVANSAAIYANGAFAAANAATATDTTQNNSITAAFASANSAFTRANNSLNANTGGSITGDISITGNLTVTGNTTYTNTITVLIGDNIIVLNADVPQSAQPTESAGIEIDRGAQPNSSFLWIETSGKWAANNGNGSIFIAADSAESYANSAFAAANAATATNTTQNNSITAAFASANAAFLQANTPSHVANSAAIYANGAFAAANAATATDTTQNNSITAAFNTANASFTVANNAVTSANGTIIWNTANAAFLAANSATATDTTQNNSITAAFLQANTPSHVANSAASYANSAFAAANSATAIDTTQNNSITAAFNTANASFLVANGAAFVANTDYTTLSATAGVYGNASHVSVTTLTANGRVSSITNTAIAISADAVTSGTLAVARGGTGVTTSTGTGAVVLGTAPTITLPTINNIRQGYSTTATAAGTTTLTVNSNYLQFFTGTTTQTLQLPAPQTMTLGMGFFVVNNSTGNLSVIASNSAAVATILAGTAMLFVSIDLTAGNGAAGWAAEIVGFSTTTGTGAVTLNTSPTLFNVSVSSVNVTNTTASTTKTTGALTVAGGVGVAGNVSTLGINVDNRIDWASTGFAQPSFTNRSAGQKITLYPAISGSLVDYSIGIDGGVLWTTVPAATTAYQFKWYGGETQIASLSGAGTLDVISANITSSNTSTSNTTGALRVTGGVGVRGNVAADGIIFPDNTRQTTAASGGGASIGDVLALSIALG